MFAGVRVDNLILRLTPSPHALFDTRLLNIKYVRYAMFHSRFVKFITHL